MPALAAEMDTLNAASLPKYREAKAEEVQKANQTMQNLDNTATDAGNKMREAGEKGKKAGSDAGGAAKSFTESARGRIEVVAVVTMRFKPFQMNGRRVHQVGIPWHWGYTGLSTGPSANELTPHVGDANTMIPEYKAFLVDVKKV